MVEEKPKKPYRCRTATSFGAETKKGYVPLNRAMRLYVGDKRSAKNAQEL